MLTTGFKFAKSQSLEAYRKNPAVGDFQIVSSVPSSSQFSYLQILIANYSSSRLAKRQRARSDRPWSSEDVNLWNPES